MQSVKLIWRRILIHKAVLVSGILALGFNVPAAGQNPAPQGLKDYYSSFFPIGVAIRPQDTSGPESELILKHFNSITAENAMKMGPIHPRQNEYNWAPADQIVDFAVKNKLRIRGHTLCWHNQAPSWLFTDGAGKMVSKDTLLQRLKKHIHNVVTRYKGKIYAWDVVNEVIADEPDILYRKSPWFQICGEEFIAKAFEYAHEADPQALLFYNDYNTEDPVKRDKIFQMLKKLKDANVPVNGVGLQGHWSIYHPSEAQLNDAIAKFSALGLTVQVTELDISVYPSEDGRRDKRQDESDAFTNVQEDKQVDQYKMVFKVFRENKSKLSGITFWNLSDKASWLDNFPVRGRKNYPLLFDQELKPKKAYWEVIKF